MADWDPESGDEPDPLAEIPAILRIPHLMYVTGWPYQTLVRTPKLILELFMMVSSIQSTRMNEERAIGHSQRNDREVSF